MKYSTRPKNTRDRSPQVKRSPHELPEVSQSTAGRGYVLTILETQPVSIPVVQPQQTTTGQPGSVIAKVHQPSGPSSSSAQPTSYVVVDDQQPGTSRQMISTHLQLHLHNRRRVSTTLLDYPVSSQLFPVCSCINRWTHHSHFHPPNFEQHCHQCHLLLIMNIQDLPASPASRVSPNQRIIPHKSHQTRPF